MGAIALFGEKYGDKVHIVKFGKSVELCGGCHAKATGQIGLFKIVSEGAIAAGVRRIEAVTGEAAEAYVHNLEDILKSVRSFFNNAPDITAAVKKMVSDNETYKKQVEEFVKEKTAQLADSLAKTAEDYGGVKLVRISTGFNNAVMMRNVANILTEKYSGMAVAGAVDCEGKPQLLLAYSKDLTAAGKNAGAEIREAAKLIQGGGGGQASLATAGGRDSSGLKAAMDKLVELATK